MIILRKYGGESAPYLSATDAESAAGLAKLKDGQEVTVEMKRARSGQQHRLFFALIRAAFNNQQTDFPTEKALRKAILIQSGYFEPELRITGEIVNVAKSLSYHNMKQEEFNQCFEDCVAIICEYILPGTEPEALINEVGR